ncbi:MULTISPECIES: UxaA family hydrolase [Dictyoglomus]|jgi:(2R)-sulfolactate sulfo-lyase subunit beta|uniref:Galactarate dehydratase n=1 Tax=Dictyoglomus turgidum (strain DSM 6724 / Z-1310) TaxID=515635 RepID=B8E1Z6_DICTD|nr:MULTISPECIES: UxaA family hydrolase [Dictyoglomus]ACK41779.1 Galactarate dehydratase [Dictyoglomus turgidum DSM 6724]HBU31376.1 galactarate dehydratase [Dictyoglomus sp.]
MERITFKGYRRPDGRVGVRNYVAIISVDDISNTAVEGICKLISGTLPVTHPYGRLQFGRDLDLFFRTMIGTGANPNIASAIVIGIEENWANKIAEGISKTGKPVEAFYIEGYGDLRTIERASRVAMKLVQDASEIEREEVDISELVMSIKCGESDTTSGLAANPTVGKVVEKLLSYGGTVLFGETSELTGGEHIIAQRIKDEKQRQRFWDMFNEYQEFIKNEGVDLLGSQPTEGNIKGGLSSIEEKALGNIQKIGKAQIDGVLEMAETPPGRGLYFMNTSSAAAEAITLFAAGGAVVHLFPTGQGNVVGNLVIPVIKISGNPKTVSTMSEHIDVDVSKVLTLEESLDEAGEKLWNYLLRVISGKLTCAEVLNHKEFVLTKFFRSA